MKGQPIETRGEEDPLEEAGWSGLSGFWMVLFFFFLLCVLGVFLVFVCFFFCVSFCFFVCVFLFGCFSGVFFGFVWCFGGLAFLGLACLGWDFGGRSGFCCWCFGNRCFGGIVVWLVFEDVPNLFGKDNFPVGGLIFLERL